MILLVALLAAGAAQPGLALLREGKIAEAAASLEKALAREPKNAELANDLGFAYARLGRDADAERLYRRAAALAPSRWYAYANLAELLADSPQRWARADETLAFLARGLGRARGAAAQTRLSLRIADFERSVGRTAAARARIAALRAQKLPPEEDRRAGELLDAVAQEERARAGEDWPEPQLTAAQQQELERAEQALPGADALAAADRLVAAQPASRAARWLRARALDAVGRVDEAARDLAVLTQLSPSHAPALRRLGEILALQGGLLEADRADEALRQALALEPSWTSLWLLRARVALRRGRPEDALRFVRHLSSPEAQELEQLARAQAFASAAAPAGARSAAQREPSPEARALYQQAQEWSAAPDRSRELLSRALELSPGFVEAAGALFALSGAVPEPTAQALRNDGDGLLALSAAIRRAGGPAAAVRPLIDRAVELGAPEALYERARLSLEDDGARVGAGEPTIADREGALADLTGYVASAPLPQHLDEARALRAQLVPEAPSDSAARKARLELADDRPEAALATLGGSCSSAPPGRLLLLGEVHEFRGALADAAACYQLAVRAAPGAPEPLQRFARAAAQAPSRPLLPELRAAAAHNLAAAEWALAQLEPDAMPHLDRYLALAPADGAFVARARAAREELLRSSTAAAEARERRRLGLGVALAAALLAAAFLLWGGATLPGALRRAPGLFPTLARAVEEVRHDVIKHRASGLGLARDHRADAARALLEPEPASAVVTRGYERLRAAARAHGIALRRLGREPTFGPLVRDLRRAEALLRSAEELESGALATQASLASLASIDERLRTTHSSRLAALLRLGPRTRIDAAALASWIRAVEAEARQGGAAWSSPSIHLSDLAVEFPVERSALSVIFANLLRNAQAAAGREGRVVVRLGQERDAAGRNLHVLLVGDSAREDLSLEAIESRESGRGLAIVRDLTREWHGHLVVRAEEAPWRKAVGACFPAP